MTSLHLNSLTARSRSRSPKPPSRNTSTADNEQPIMASATGVPAGHPATDHAPHDDLDAAAADHEPLLGEPGDVAQEKQAPMPYNLITGTAILAQAGILILFATVWAAVFSHDWIWPFSGHPVANALAILLAVQAVLVLQPTHTPAQKRAGALVHGAANLLALVGFLAAFVMIYVNKAAHQGAHFESAHARLGLITYLVLAVQTLVGFTMYFVPALYGSVDKAKSIWKYHRMSGYVVSTLALATVCAATTTDYNRNVLGMKLWVMIVASVLVLVGVLPRVKLQKLGIKTHH